MIENILVILKTLFIDRWYAMLLIASFSLLVLGLTTPLQVVSNAALIAIGFGGFLAGLGEMINHPARVSTGVMMGKIASVRGHPRRPHRGGTALVVIGVVFALLGGALIVRDLV